HPTALPDGRHVLITAWTKGTGLNDADVAVLDIETGKHRVLFKGAEPHYLDPGFIVFFRAGAYHAVKFDLVSQTVSGETVRVLDDAYGNSPEGDQVFTSAAAMGTVAYLS